MTFYTDDLYYIPQFKKKPVDHKPSSSSSSEPIEDLKKIDDTGSFISIEFEDVYYYENANFSKLR